MSQELRHGILVVDYGSKYSLLLARKIREQGTYCEVWPANDPRIDAFIAAHDAPAKALILSGGGEKLDIENPPKLLGGLLDVDLPVLAIGSCMQAVAEELGGKASDAAPEAECLDHIRVEATSPILAGFGVGSTMRVWAPNQPALASLPNSLVSIAERGNAQCIAYAHAHKPIYGFFFHAESGHSERGMELIRNFVYRIAEASNEWNMGAFMERSIAAIREQVGDARVICALSGGVDSSVVAALLAQAIGDQLTCIFVDTGVLRLNERKNVEKMVRDHFKVDLRVVDASDRFLGELAGVEDPERKRKIIGEQFIRVFEDMTREIPDATFLAQGTLYPDVIESVSVRGQVVSVKSHHNVGGLPEDMKFELIEPLRELFKDEVRELGRQLGLPEQMVNRHPFPNPKLSIRILGEVTRERVATLQQADDIFISMLREHGLYGETWQAFVVLLPVRTVGFTGEKRSYEWACSLRAVNSTDGMTAEPTHLPHDFLCSVSEKIIKSVPRINRVVYDISSKPPATIEWE